MKVHKKEAIEAKVREIWKKDFFYDDACTARKVEPPEILVIVESDYVRIKISQMYDPPSLSFTHLSKLGRFFGTKNINDDRFSYSGCETCDYGSSYGFTLVVRPDLI